LCVLVLAGCDDRAAIDSAAIATPDEQHLANDVASATVRVSDTTITTAGRINVQLSVQSEIDSVSLTDEPDFEGWTVVDRHTDSVVHTWEWTLEPFLDGAYIVPSFTVTAGDKSLETPPTEVLVTSVLAEGDEQLAGMKGIVDAPPADRLWLFASIAGGLLALLGAGIGLAFMLAARARHRFELMAPAHEVALARLDVAARPPPAGVEQLIVRVADITRTYIEDRYSVRAPEQTTEEFLDETRSSVRFRDEDVTLLERFLTRVDLIKFAGAGADQRQADEACDAVRKFIASTGSHESAVVLTKSEAAELEPLAVRRVRVGFEFETNNANTGGAA
jgi:hypothetical protein